MSEQENDQQVTQSPDADTSEPTAPEVETTTTTTTDPDGSTEVETETTTEPTDASGAGSNDQQTHPQDGGAPQGQDNGTRF